MAGEDSIHPGELRGDDQSAAPRGPLPEDRLLGKSLGGCAIKQVLGRGGMGKVYLAVQESLNRKVAVKVLPQSRSNDEKFLARFQQEALALAAVSHPNIVQVIDAGRQGQDHYLIMEYVAGGTLLDRIKEGKPLAVDEACRILLDVARGLSAVHEVHIVHRDIKPGNIFLTPRGEAKLGDFGLARNELDAKTMTTGGHGVGTVHYMSPEQILKGLMDARSDLYSLGITFWECLAGRRPFADATSVTSIAKKHTEGTVPDLSSVRPDAPPEVVDLLRRMTARERDQRIGSAEEVARILESILGLPRSVAPAAVRRRGRAGRRIALIAGIAAAALAGAFYLLLPALVRWGFFDSRIRALAFGNDPDIRFTAHLESSSKLMLKVGDPRAVGTLILSLSTAFPFGDIQGKEAKGLEARLLKPRLAGAMPGLEIASGTFDATIKAESSSSVALHGVTASWGGIVVEGLEVAVSEGRGTLKWSSLRIRGKAASTRSLALTAKAGEILFEGPLEVPLWGGTLATGREIRIEPAGQGWRLKTSLHPKGIEASGVLRELGIDLKGTTVWAPIGEILLEADSTEARIGGALQTDAFDGKVTIREILIMRPFDVRPAGYSFAFAAGDSKNPVDLKDITGPLGIPGDFDVRVLLDGRVGLDGGGKPLDLDLAVISPTESKRKKVLDSVALQTLAVCTDGWRDGTVLPPNSVNVDWFGFTARIERGSIFTIRGVPASGPKPASPGDQRAMATAEAKGEECILFPKHPLFTLPAGRPIKPLEFWAGVVNRLPRR